MKAQDIHDHFRAVGDWVDPARTVDKIIVGDPSADVRRVLVTWISDFAAVRAAVARDCQLLITHEPTFWIHANEIATLEQRPAGSPTAALAARKRRFIDDNRLVILRVHDAWDRMPEIGIPWAWARFLGLGDRPAVIGGDGYLHRYDIPPLTLDALATQIARRTAAIGEPAVQVVGDPDRTISKVGIGTGCACSPFEFSEMDCDVSVVCDDGSCYWENLQWAADADHPTIRVNHGTSEEPGMVTLTQYVNDTFPGITAEHLPHGSCFRLVGC